MTKPAISALWVLIFIVSVSVLVTIDSGWKLGIAAGLTLAALDEMMRYK